MLIHTPGGYPLHTKTEKNGTLSQATTKENELWCHTDMAHTLYHQKAPLATWPTITFRADDGDTQSVLVDEPLWR